MEDPTTWIQVVWKGLELGALVFVIWIIVSDGKMFRRRSKDDG